LLREQLVGALQCRFAALGIRPGLVDLGLEHGGFDRVERGAFLQRLSFLEVHGKYLAGDFCAQRRRRLGFESSHCAHR
jgi:hypothetical protein